MRLAMPSSSAAPASSPSPRRRSDRAAGSSTAMCCSDSDRSSAKRITASSIALASTAARPASLANGPYGFFFASSRAALYALGVAIAWSVPHSIDFRPSTPWLCARVRQAGVSSSTVSSVAAAAAQGARTRPPRAPSRAGCAARRAPSRHAAWPACTAVPEGTAPTSCRQCIAGAAQKRRFRSVCAPAPPATRQGGGAASPVPAPRSGGSRRASSTPATL